MKIHFTEKQFQIAVLSWFAHSGRKTLPWQQNPTPYRVWISEIMLQQTQVLTAIPYYEKFMQRFPSVISLATSPVDDVLALWSGLGYYTRARNLHKCAQILVEKHGGEFPETVVEVTELPGIGRSTAGAILSLSRNTHAAIFDGNVKRVLCRVLGIRWFDNVRRNETEMWRIAESLVPPQANHYNQAMMDLGATICTRSKPQCSACPLRLFCVAHKEQNFTDYPGSKTVKKIPVRQTRLLILLDQQHVLLTQRPPTGIWGGLWSLPEIGQSLSPGEFAADLGLHIPTLSAVPPFRHTFSHFHLDIHAYIAKADDSPSPATSRIMSARRIEDRVAQWQSLHELDAVGLPAPIRRLLDPLLTETP